MDLRWWWRLWLLLHTACSGWRRCSRLHWQLLFCNWWGWCNLLSRRNRRLLHTSLWRWRWLRRRGLLCNTLRRGRWLHRWRLLRNNRRRLLRNTLSWQGWLHRRRLLCNTLGWRGWLHRRRLLHNTLS